MFRELIERRNLIELLGKRQSLRGFRRHLRYGVRYFPGWRFRYSLDKIGFDVHICSKRVFDLVDDPSERVIRKCVVNDKFQLAQIVTLLD